MGNQFDYSEASAQKEQINSGHWGEKRNVSWTFYTSPDNRTDAGRAQCRSQKYTQQSRQLNNLQANKT